MDSLAVKMSPAWWELPINLLKDRTREASVQFERIMCQIWHFELAILLHLPFMLRAVTDRRYEYSYVCCLDASRNLIKRWISIRDSQSTLLFSNLLEFQAFTAATTLILGLLGPSKTMSQEILQERHEDNQLVETVVQNFERLKQHGIGMSVDTQSISVIRTLQRFLRGESPSDKLRLEIPYFGIIHIARSGAVQPIEGERILGANACQNSSSLRHGQSTMVHSMITTDRNSAFDSNSRGEKAQERVRNEEINADNGSNGDTILHFSGGHFQVPDTSDIQNCLDIGEWSFEDTDMILFDSLVNTDLVGNWTL